MVCRRIIVRGISGEVEERRDALVDGRFVPSSDQPSRTLASGDEFEPWLLVRLIVGRKLERGIWYFVTVWMHLEDDEQTPTSQCVLCLPHQPQSKAKTAHRGIDQHAVAMAIAENSSDRASTFNAFAMRAASTSTWNA